MNYLKKPIHKKLFGAALGLTLGLIFIFTWNSLEIEGYDFANYERNFLLQFLFYLLSPAILVLRLFGPPETIGILNFPLFLALIWGVLGIWIANSENKHDILVTLIILLIIYVITSFLGNIVLMEMYGH